MNGLQWEGMDEFQAALHKYPQVADKATKAALYQEAERIMTHIKRAQLVPIDDAHLKNSAFVTRPHRSYSGVIAVLMGFGGQASAYALAVHEHPSVHSPPSWEGKKVKFSPGGPGFLRDPVNERRKMVIKRVSAAVVAAMRKVT